MNAEIITRLEMLEKVKSRKGYRWVEASAAKSVGGECSREACLEMLEKVESRKSYRSVSAVESVGDERSQEACLETLEKVESCKSYRTVEASAAKCIEGGPGGRDYRTSTLHAGKTTSAGSKSDEFRAYYDRKLVT